MVIEDSLIGLEAALGARMNCVITYTGSTESQVSENTRKIEKVQCDERSNLSRFRWRISYFEVSY